MKKSKSHYAIFGNTTLKRAYCDKCKGYALVIDNILQCCDMGLESNKINVTKRFTNPRLVRKRPSVVDQKNILLKQENKCFYCRLEFGTPLFRKTTGKVVILKMHWDHLVPYVYSQNNKSNNFVAACHICNGIKSSKMFETVQDVIDLVTYERAKKGYEIL